MVVAAANKMVLVIDDDADIREALVDALSDEGHAVVALADGMAGLEYLRNNEAPGLVLLDWNMTPMNGGQFMEEFAKEPTWSSIPVVLLSADVRIHEKARTADFAGYLKKPTKLPELFGIVARYCF